MTERAEGPCAAGPEAPRNPSTAGPEAVPGTHRGPRAEDREPTVRYCEHIGETLGTPALVGLEPGLFLLRFEVMKIASARTAVRTALARGLVRPGGCVVDSSSGIYASALALACHEAGLGCVVVGSTTIDATLRTQLEVLGVRLEQMPPSSSLKQDQDRRVRRVRELLAEHPDWHWMRQYHDPVHYHGYRPFARQVAALLRERGHDSVTLVAPVGSGVSSGSLAQGLAAAGTRTTLVGVQPFGSVTFGSERVQDPDMLIAGIGSSIEFENVRHEAYEHIHWVSFRVGRSGSVSLLRDHAVFAGLSTGASYAVARWLRDRKPPALDGAVLFVAPDTGHRYVDSVFADASEAPDVRDFAPHGIEDPDRLAEDLELPWSAMHWGGRPRSGRPDR